VENYVWFDSSYTVAGCLGADVGIHLAPFAVVTGHTHFGDLFLRDPGSREFGVLTQGTCTLFDTGYFEDDEFRDEYLAAPGIIEHVLRPSDIAALQSRLGVVARLEVYFPVPIPALGGSDDLSTYDRGGIWEYLSFVLQTLGVTRDLLA
jgi:hypothetical protein